MKTKFKKVHRLIDIQTDPRICNVRLNFDRPGNHMVECIDGYKFSNFNSTMEFGTISQLCNSINTDLFETN